MNQILKSLMDRVQSLPAETQERVISAFDRRLAEIEAGDDDRTKLEALRRDLQIGLDQLDRGEGIPSDRVFAELKS